MTATYTVAEFQTVNVTDLGTDKPSQNSSLAVPVGCLVTSSSDGTGDLVSPEAVLLISKLKTAVLIPLLFVFGATANILNMAVFKKQGLNDRVNLILFTMAVVDGVTICFYFLIYSEHIFKFNSPEVYGIVFSFVINNKITIFYSCVYGSTLLSAVVAVERCICVLFPLQAKTILKTKYMAGIIFTGVPLLSFLRLVVMAKYSVVCVFDKRTQTTVMDMYITDFQLKNKELLNFLDGILYGFVITVGCVIVIMIATVVTSVKLWQSVAWRRRTSNTGSRKEMAVTRTLILLSLQFLLFNTPFVFLRMYPLYNPDFGPKGKYRLYFQAWANAGEMSSLTNLAFSFVIFVFSSSKYRQTLRSLFASKTCLDKKLSEKRIVKRKTLNNKILVSNLVK